MDIKGPAEAQVRPREAIQLIKLHAQPGSIKVGMCEPLLSAHSCILLSAFAPRRTVFSVHYHACLHKLQKYELPVVAIYACAASPCPRTYSVHTTPLKTLTPLPFVLLHRHPLPKYPMLGPEVTLQIGVSSQCTSPLADPAWVHACLSEVTVQT